MSYVCQGPEKNCPIGLDTLSHVGQRSRVSHMSEMINEPEEAQIAIPALTLGWRMQMAMAHANRTREYMALKCGVAASTISRWLHDGGVRPPRRGDLEIWARECRVPRDWLESSQERDGDPAAGQPTVTRDSWNPVLHHGDGNLDAPIRGHLYGLPSSISMIA